MNLLDDERFERTAMVLRQGLEQRHYFGGQIYISRNGKTVLSAAFGKRGSSASDADLSTGDLMLRLSSTKPIGAVAVAQQFEQGKLAWDDPVTKFIQEFGQNGKTGITIRHLLTHTAGFRSADRVKE